MKKMLSMILVVLFLFSLMPSVLGADTDGLSDAILRAKEKITIPDTYSEFESDLSAQEDGTTVYLLTWYAKGDLGYNDHISVQINNHGDIISYRNLAYEDTANEMRFAVYNGEEMKAIAHDWLKGVNPSWMAELPLEEGVAPEYGNPRYHTDSVRFLRKVNGLDYCGDTVRISVNNLTGEVISMHATWTYETPAYATDTALGQEEASKHFFMQSPMNLAYHSTGEQTAIPVFSPENPSLALNARTGEEWVEYNPYRVYGTINGGSFAVTEDTMAEEEKFTQSERKNLEQVDGLLGEDELKSLAESLKHTGLDDAAFVSLNYENYKEEQNGEEKLFYNAHLSYVTPGEKEIRHTVLFDAQTGELLSYNSYPANFDDTDATVKEETARKTAESFLKAYAPEEFSKSKEDAAVYDKKSDYAFSYLRYANGLPFADNFLSLSVDKNTGRIQRFYKNWNEEMVFAPAEGLIDAATAEQRLMEQAGLSLSYAKAQDGESDTPVIDLMYTLNHSHPYHIDAKTGDLLTYSMEPYVPKNEAFTLPADIQGHYAEQQILTLIKSGMFEGEDLFRPDDRITQREMLAFVCSLHMGYIPYAMEFESLTQNARSYGIKISDLDPDAPVTREKAVEMIICALGYQEIAQLSNIFVTAFLDQAEINSEKLGYIALAQGLNIINGNGNGYFKPQESLSRADAAIMIYNYLNR